MKEVIKKTPLIGRLSISIKNKLFRSTAPISQLPFPGSKQYWINRYNTGINSGPGSYNKLGKFKAEIINDFVKKHNISTIIEFGCGDGNQLSYAQYPFYLGFDISNKALEICKERFKEDSAKTFKLMEEYAGEKADLTLSLDVIYHLIEDHIYDAYMERLFDAAKRFVIIYSSNKNENTPDQPQHILHRKFSSWVDQKMPKWELIHYIPNRFPFRGNAKDGSFSDFFIYECRNRA